MIKISEEDRVNLRKIIENADELLAGDDLRAVLNPLDDFIAFKGFDDDYDLTDMGRIAQRIFDRVYYNN